MFLFEICHAVYKVVAIGSLPDGCQLLDFISELGANLQKDGDRVLALLKRVARDGPPRNLEICHQIEGKINQFTQGRIRVLWFYDEGKIIICTHGFVKKTPKTPTREINHAKALMKYYFEAKGKGMIEIIPWEEGNENE
jgi:phage-related protein